MKTDHLVRDYNQEIGRLRKEIGDKADARRGGLSIFVAVFMLSMLSALVGLFLFWFLGLIGCYFAFMTIWRTNGEIVTLASQLNEKEEGLRNLLAR
jgi:hypothetical protein